MANKTLDDAAACLVLLRKELLGQRVKGDRWEGELSASALSTATAVSALATVLHEARDATRHSEQELVQLICRGCSYLDTQQNPDGGYGDTDRSHSNIATSYLVLAAKTLASTVIGGSSSELNSSGIARLERYIEAAGSIEGLKRRYGKDKTFVVPILTNLAIAGRVDWSVVPRLPFEAAVFPGRMYRFLRMPVVSYAIPALVAIGQVHHFRGPVAAWPIRSIRKASIARTLNVLRQMQPESGGYLEATPLTSFVLMSLAASGRADHEVSASCVRFLKASIREDGSWPIDTNLATWVSSLAIHALAQASEDEGPNGMTPELIDWHLSCQHVQQHPFTGASPGGWGWTDLSGAVPDGDDTPAAVIAALHYRRNASSEAQRQRIDQAVVSGLSWLSDLQNSDGGLPTFCRGWGKLPFDRSSTDLTAHYVRAIDMALHHPAIVIPNDMLKRLQAGRQRALRFLKRQQRGDGSWLPLWFGNQDRKDDENPIYGTARVLLATASDPLMGLETKRGIDFLLAEQNADGGWGGGSSYTERFSVVKRPEGHESDVVSSVVSSIEETSVALEAIAEFLRTSPSCTLKADAGRVDACEQAIIDAVQCVCLAVSAGRHHCPWPIGFYFAKLWYHEKLYPLVFATAALGAATVALKKPTEEVDSAEHLVCETGSISRQA